MATLLNVHYVLSQRARGQQTTMVNSELCAYDSDEFIRAFPNKNGLLQPYCDQQRPTVTRSYFSMCLCHHNPYSVEEHFLDRRTVSVPVPVCSHGMQLHRQLPAWHADYNVTICSRKRGDAKKRLFSL